MTLLEQIEILEACQRVPFEGLPRSVPMMWFDSIDFELRRWKGKKRVRGPGLIVHLIRAHQFFEGEHSPYRVDPRKLCEVLGLASAPP